MEDGLGVVVGVMSDGDGGSADLPGGIEQEFIAELASGLLDGLAGRLSAARTSHWREMKGRPAPAARSATNCASAVDSGRRAWSRWATVRR